MIVTPAFLLFIAIASPSANEQQNEVVPRPEEIVRLSMSRKGSTLTLECKPKSEKIAESIDWISACNTLGNSALEKSAKDGLITSIDGPIFRSPPALPSSIQGIGSITLKSVMRKVEIIAPAL